MPSNENQPRLIPNTVRAKVDEFYFAECQCQDCNQHSLAGLNEWSATMISQNYFEVISLIKTTIKDKYLEFLIFQWETKFAMIDYP